MIGTQMKLSSCFRWSLRRSPMFMKPGSRLTRGTTIGLPDSTTWPVMPSPTLMRADRARSSKPSTASTCSSPSRSSVTMPRTTL